MAASNGLLDEAFEWLERAYRERNFLPGANHLVEMPLLTGDPSYDELITRTGARPANGRR